LLDANRAAITEFDFFHFIFLVRRTDQLRLAAGECAAAKAALILGNEVAQFSDPFIAPALHAQMHLLAAAQCSDCPGLG
jgi:hypothetical protein